METKKLNYDIAKLIESFLAGSLMETKQLFEKFVNEFYYELDENNRDDNYYKISQTYLIFNELIGKKDDYSRNIKLIKESLTLQNIFYDLTDRYRKYDVTYKKLKDDYGKENFNIYMFIYKLRREGLITWYDDLQENTPIMITAKGEIIYNLFKHDHFYEI